MAVVAPASVLDGVAAPMTAKRVQEDQRARDDHGQDDDGGDDAAHAGHYPAPGTRAPDRDATGISAHPLPRPAQRHQPPLAPQPSRIRRSESGCSYVVAATS